MDFDDRPILDQPAPDPDKIPDVNLLREQGYQLANALPPFIEEFEYLFNLPHRTAEEEASLKEITEILFKAFCVVHSLRDFFGERLYKQSIAIYYRAKELAAQGNLAAQKVVDDLEPDFKVTLKDSFGNN